MSFKKMNLTSINNTKLIKSEKILLPKEEIFTIYENSITLEINEINNIIEKKDSELLFSHKKNVKPKYGLLISVLQKEFNKCNK